MSALPDYHEIKMPHRNIKLKSGLGKDYCTWIARISQYSASREKADRQEPTYEKFE